MAVQLRNDELIELLRGDFQARYEPNFAWKSAASVLRGLPGLRGAWMMGNFDANGNEYDVGGIGKTLSYNGNPTYNYRDLAPYLDLDGTGDYLSRNDEADLDILGTETYVAAAARGLTLGLWVNPDRLTNAEILIGKATGVAATSSYYLSFQGNLAGDPFRFSVCDGAAFDSVQVTPSIATVTGSWYFVAGRYDPSTEIKCYVGYDGALETNTLAAGIPAALNNSNAQLTVGSLSAGGGNLLDGQVSMAWLSCMYLSDAAIATIFQQTRAMFGE